MSHHPKVSIVIPVYNGADYLSQAIDSALAQIYDNIEVLVINDRSTDEGKTESIAKSYGDKIRYFHKENGGVASALNLGIHEMRGEYFSWLSHDDLYYPHKIESQITHLKNQQKNKVIYGDYDLIDSNSNYLGKLRLPKIAPSQLRYALLTESPINGCTALIPKICFETTGLFKENLKTTQDYEMWFRMAERYCFEHIANVVLKSRLHAKQGSLTIPSHWEEKNRFYMNCLSHFFDEQKINQQKGNTIEVPFFKIAIKLKLKGYLPAAKLALELAEKRLNHEGRSQIFSSSLRKGLFTICTPLLGKLIRISTRWTMNFSLAKEVYSLRVK